MCTVWHGSSIPTEAATRVNGQKHEITQMIARSTTGASVVLESPQPPGNAWLSSSRSDGIENAKIGRTRAESKTTWRCQALVVKLLR